MSQQGQPSRYSDWERQQSQQFRQQQSGYLDLPYVPSKKKQKSVSKKQQPQTKLVKVWHEGAD
jgi:hypothetical protein